MASSTSSIKPILGAALALAAVVLAIRWRSLERSSEASVRRAAELEKQTSALSKAVDDLKARPATERVIVKERSADLQIPGREAAPGPAPGGAEPPREQASAETKESAQRRKREAYEKLEGEFEVEPVDPTWSRKTEQALAGAIQALPAGLGEVESTVSKSQHTRIEATFASAAEYNQFFKSLFTIRGNPDDPGAPTIPLFPDHGGVFAPYKEATSDGRFHAVIFVDRARSAP